MERVLIVTGGSRGIGAAVCQLAARDGWAVCVNFRTQSGRAEEVVEAIRRMGGKAIPVGADVSVEADVLRLFETCEELLGRPTGLVNNAGVILGYGRLDRLGSADLTRSFAVNALSAFLCAREAVKRMSTRHATQFSSLATSSTIV